MGGFPRLIAHGLDVRFGSTAEALAERAEAVGVELDRIASTDFGRMVVLRRP